jgi:hypothetical protein
MAVKRAQSLKVVFVRAQIKARYSNASNAGYLASIVAEV